ncbi:MAG: ribonuclease HI [Planctomycetota bacterium]|nr:ribonuclease HI [Planctomycetota bacterium]
MTQRKSEAKRVVIFTDGACLGNPGPGGYGVVLLSGKHRKELSRGFRDTTNNRMELRAAIAGLEALKRSCKVVLHTDSRYLADAITQGWASRWRAKGWMRNKKERALNPDLWERLLVLCETHDVEFKWVPGHAGVDENERCDALATAAAEGSDLEEDHGRERSAGIRAGQTATEAQRHRE